MIRIFIKSAIVLNMAVLFFACTSKQDKSAEQPVLVVNERTLTVKEFAERLASELKVFDALSAKHPQNVVRAKEDILQRFINEALVRDWAEQNRLKITD